MEWFSQERALYQALGPLRFFLLLAGLLALILGFLGIYWWLSARIGWPEAYGFECHGRRCLLDEAGQSHRLLRTARPDELMLFAWFWFAPVAFALTCAAIWLRRALAHRRNTIRSPRP